MGVLLVIAYVLPIVGLLAAAVLIGALLFLGGYSFVEWLRDRKPATARVAAEQP